MLRVLLVLICFASFSVTALPLLPEEQQRLSMGLAVMVDKECHVQSLQDLFIKMVVF